MAEPTTPTLKKPQRRKRGGALRSAQLRNRDRAGETMADFGAESSSQDEEELFGLLGVTSPPPKTGGDTVNGGKTLERGFLPVTKADIDQATNKSTKKGRKKQALDSEPEAPQIAANGATSPTPKSRPARQKQDKARKEDDPAVMSEGEALQVKPRRGRNKAIGASEHHSPADTAFAFPVQSSKPVAQPQPIQLHDPVLASDSFDVTSLSRSLPSEHFFAPSSGRSKGSANGRHGKADEDAVWEMPSAADTAASQEFTWQQKLGSYPFADGTSTPAKRKSKPKTRMTSAHAPSPLNPQTTVLPTHFAAGTTFAPPTRPSHARRASTDAITPASVPNIRSFSAFDSMLPFHTGMNVHRAPQTPVKTASGQYAAAIGGGMLPIVPGEFPRLNQGSKGVFGTASVGGPKYAGPTFHNSPHASSLPKPDLEDF